MNIEGGLLWKRKGTSISGKGTRDNNGGWVSSKHIIYMYEHVMMNPTILYNSYQLIKYKQKISNGVKYLNIRSYGAR
jgi:hypothetical protein